MGQIHDLGPRGRAQGSSWLVPAMMVQSCYLGCREWGWGNRGCPVMGQRYDLGMGYQTMTAPDHIWWDAVVVWSQRMGHSSDWDPWGQISPESALVRKSRCGERNTRQLHQLGSVLVKTVRDLYSKGCKCPWWWVFLGSSALHFPWCEIPLRATLVVPCCFWLYNGMTQSNMIPILFYVIFLNFWAPQGFWCFCFVVHCFLWTIFFGL